MRTDLALQLGAAAAGSRVLTASAITVGGGPMDGVLRRRGVLGTGHGVSACRSASDTPRQRTTTRRRFGWAAPGARFRHAAARLDADGRPAAGVGRPGPGRVRRCSRLRSRRQDRSTRADRRRVPPTASPVARRYVTIMGREKIYHRGGPQHRSPSRTRAASHHGRAGVVPRSRRGARNVRRPRCPARLGPHPLDELTATWPTSSVPGQVPSSVRRRRPKDRWQAVRAGAARALPSPHLRPHRMNERSEATGMTERAGSVDGRRRPNGRRAHRSRSRGPRTGSGGQRLLIEDDGGSSCRTVGGAAGVASALEDPWHDRDDIGDITRISSHQITATLPRPSRWPHGGGTGPARSGERTVWRAKASARCPVTRRSSAARRAHDMATGSGPPDGDDSPSGGAPRLARAGVIS